MTNVYAELTPDKNANDIYNQAVMNGPSEDKIVRAAIDNGGYVHLVLSGGRRDQSVFGNIFGVETPDAEKMIDALSQVPGVARVSTNLHKLTLG